MTPLARNNGREGVFSRFSDAAGGVHSSGRQGLATTVIQRVHDASKLVSKRGRVWTPRRCMRHRIPFFGPVRYEFPEGKRQLEHTPPELRIFVHSAVWRPRGRARDALDD